MTAEPHAALLDRAMGLRGALLNLDADQTDVANVISDLLARIDSLDRATVAILDKHSDRGRELAACQRRAEDAEYALFTATAVRWQRLHVPPLHPQASCLPCLPPDGESCVICSGDGYDLGRFVAETMRWESIDDAMGPISDYDGCWFLVLSPPVADGETT